MRGRDEAQEEKHEEQTAEDDGHRRRGQEWTECQRTEQESPPRGSVADAAWVNGRCGEEDREARLVTAS